MKDTSTLEKAIIVGLRDGREDFDEMERLVDSAGAALIRIFAQKRRRTDPSYFIGKGKAFEVAEYARKAGAGIVIFDGELSPAQQKNLDDIFDLKVIDRTRLILDIFAKRARTAEGKLQVELAQLSHLLPRLTGRGVEFSQLEGGIGTKGPGETKLEYDRRRIRKKINLLQKEIEKIRERRSFQRVNRQHPLVSLVGYTNAGKSTLLNTLTDSKVLVDDRLFATLDPTTRKLKLPVNLDILLTDTVGFIRKLPHHLIVSFRATLEEINESDLLLHVVDASSPRMDEEMESVRIVLKELGAGAKPLIIVLNKIDKCGPKAVIERMISRFPDSVCISALKGDGVKELLERMTLFFSNRRVFARFSLPYALGAKYLPLFYAKGEISGREFRDDKVFIEGKVDIEVAKKFSEYIIK